MNATNATQASTTNTTTLTNTTTSSFNSSTIPGLNGTSSICQTATNAFMNCIQSDPTGNNTYQQNCDNCPNQYIDLVAQCQDADYEQSSFLLGVSLTCHKEAGNYCQSDTFVCDSCGKYTSKKIVETGHLDTVPQQNQTIVQQCASNSAGSKSIAMIALTIFSLF